MAARRGRGFPAGRRTSTCDRGAGLYGTRRGGSFREPRRYGRGCSELRRRPGNASGGRRSGVVRTYISGDRRGRGRRVGRGKGGTDPGHCRCAVRRCVPRSRISPWRRARCRIHRHVRLRDCAIFFVIEEWPTTTRTTHTRHRVNRLRPAFMLRHAPVNRLGKIRVATYATPF